MLQAVGCAALRPLNGQELAIGVKGWDGQVNLRTFTSGLQGLAREVSRRSGSVPIVFRVHRVDLVPRIPPEDLQRRAVSDAPHPLGLPDAKFN